MKVKDEEKNIKKVETQNKIVKTKHENTDNLAESKEEIKKINEEIINNYTFDNNSNGNIPVLNDGLITPTYEILNELAH